MIKRQVEKNKGKGSFEESQDGFCGGLGSGGLLVRRGVALVMEEAGGGKA